MDCLWRLWRLIKPFVFRAANCVSELSEFMATINARAMASSGKLPYLAAPSMADLADCYAVVSGVRLPLHSQILSAQSSVLRELFLAQRERGGVAAGERKPNISAAFSDGSLNEACILLELLYKPANIERPFLFKALNFQVLPGVARLAHKLDIAGVVDGIEAFLEGLAALPGPEALPTTLVTALQTAQACRLNSLARRFVTLLGSSLAAAGTQASSLLPKRVLIGLGSTTLAQLVHASAEADGRWGMSRHDGFASEFVYDKLTYSSTSAGFTFCIDNVSQYGAGQSVSSCWVPLCGYSWSLKVFPKGTSDAAGTHLSAFVGIRSLEPGFWSWKLREGVLVGFDVTICNQKVPVEAKRILASPCWHRPSDAGPSGWHRLAPLGELLMPARGFVENDRLLVRVDFTVLRTAPA